VRAILTYHSVDPSGSPISVSREQFRRHCEFLRGGAVAVVPLAEIAAAPDGRDAVAITFDDGFASFASDAWPLLREAGLPATLFVATRRVGASNAWGGRDQAGIPTLPLLGWEELGRLSSEGLDIGSHSRTHPRLSRVGAAELADELAGSAEDLARELGTRPASFCYPYGDHDRRVEGVARKLYARACTTELRALAAGDDPLRLPRLDAYYLRDPGRLEDWGSRAFRARIWLRGVARDLRGALSRGES
jgi:peptidoglycan/xylan/chitin deacetylase (PgdA/CDA1 family)